MEQPSIEILSAPRAEFYEPPPSEHPILTPGYELRPHLVAMVQEHPFSGLDSESPYIHLREFELVCLCHAIAGMTHDTLRWKLFPFSLIEGARQWYTHHVSSANGNWDKLSQILSSILSLVPCHCLTKGYPQFPSKRERNHRCGLDQIFALSEVRFCPVIAQPCIPWTFSFGSWQGIHTLFWCCFWRVVLPQDSRRSYKNPRTNH